MFTSKRLLLAATVVLLAGLFAGAMAQRKQDAGSNYMKPPTPDIVSIEAIEVTDGVMGYDELWRETAFGYTFTGPSSGAMPGFFTIAMNCTPYKVAPGEANEMTGGSWSLPVYVTSIRGGGYLGSLYGSVATGKMGWDQTGTTAEVFFTLNVNGGTGDWVGRTGYATFQGTISIDPKTGEKLMNGKLMFALK